MEFSKDGLSNWWSEATTSKRAATIVAIVCSGFVIFGITRSLIWG